MLLVDMLAYGYQWYKCLVYVFIKSVGPNYYKHLAESIINRPSL